MPDAAGCVRCGQIIDLLQQDWEHVASEFAHAVCPELRKESRIARGEIGGEEWTLPARLHEDQGRDDGLEVPE